MNTNVEIFKTSTTFDIIIMNEAWKLDPIMDPITGMNGPGYDLQLSQHKGNSETCQLRPPKGL